MIAFFFSLSDYHGQSCWRSKAQGKPRLGWRLIQISESKSSYDAGPYNLIITGCHLGQMCSELISLISSTYSSCTRTHRNWVAISDLFTISGGQYWHKKKHQQSKTILAWVILYLFYLWGHAEVCLSYSSGLENSVIVIFIDIFSSFTCMKNVVKL